MFIFAGLVVAIFILIIRFVTFSVGIYIYKDSYFIVYAGFWICGTSRSIRNGCYMSSSRWRFPSCWHWCICVIISWYLPYRYVGGRDVDAAHSAKSGERPCRESRVCSVLTGWYLLYRYRGGRDVDAAHSA